MKTPRNRKPTKGQLNQDRLIDKLNAKMLERNRARQKNSTSAKVKHEDFNQEKIA